MRLLLLLWLSFALWSVCPKLPLVNDQSVSVAAAAETYSTPPTTLANATGEGFEYGHWTFALYRESQQAQLNSLGQQGWIECFPHQTQIYCSRTTPWNEEWSARVEWKSWEAGKWTNIVTLLVEAGKVDYDQCFVWNAKRLWCSRPLS